MQKHKDIYTLNRENPDAIIYLDSDGKIICLTKEDFSSEEEFRRWKEWSDQQYQQEGQHENTYRTRKRTIADYDQAEDNYADSETALMEHEERMSRKMASHFVAREIRRRLTAKQFHRLWLYGVKGMTEEEIARLENVSHQAVSKSLRSAMRRIRKYIKK